jgi:hypothetical protein
MIKTEAPSAGESEQLQECLLYSENRAPGDDFRTFLDFVATLPYFLPGLASSRFGASRVLVLFATTRPVARPVCHF